MFIAGSLCAAQSGGKPSGQPASEQVKEEAPAEDISGTYSFLKEGEVLQINIDQQGISGYISRYGDTDSDRGAFLDHVFEKIAIHGHDVSFTTRVVHGVWFEFKGKFERGPAKAKSADGYYILKGTLMQFLKDADQKTSTRSRDVELKFLAQPDDSDVQPATKPKK
jgi:hypothetical protein